MSQPLERRIIEQARALIATPETWTQGEFARAADGNPVSWRSPQAVQFWTHAFFAWSFNPAQKPLQSPAASARLPRPSAPATAPPMPPTRARSAVRRE